jgi:L-seryl-tRNA(Ser) seleniumtransferase
MTTPRILPSIDRLRQRPAVRALETEYGPTAVLAALRSVTDTLRRELTRPGALPSPIADGEQAASTIEDRTSSQLAVGFEPSLVPVINATGVIVHTNLGRAPLAESAVRRVARLAAGYANLEYDLTAGRRGSRSVHAERLLTRVTAAPAAVVVNNNAAAVLLILAAMAQGREAIVSRGELVEIGGGFRIPDVMRQSGALVREVGTTNKTRAADYAAAISDRTALILRVHPSNFRIEGFTERPRLEELVALGQRFEIPVVEDLGSGNLLADQSARCVDEPPVAASVAAGAAVCCFSGDKLLGGPQAGIIVGKEEPLSRIRSHPLMRALRVDKMTYAALEATLLEYARGRAQTTVPVARMLTATAKEIGARAATLVERLSGHERFAASIVDGVSTVGGGGAPGSALPTSLVQLTARDASAATLEARLRGQRPPIVARIEDNRVVLDLRTVLPEQDGQLAELLAGLS